MREILFRGKRFENGEWVYGCYVNQKNKHIIFDKENEWHHYISENELGQYTGLTDKNGKKIFEGDIIKDYSQLTNLIILWENELCRWVRSETLNTTDRLWYSINDIFLEDGCEVIGNIYDNPELLEGDDVKD